MMCSTACRNDVMFAIIVPQGTHCSAKPSPLGEAHIVLPQANIIRAPAKQVLVPHPRPTLGVKIPSKKFFRTTFKRAIDRCF